MKRPKTSDYKYPANILNQYIDHIETDVEKRKAWIISQLPQLHMWARAMTTSEFMEHAIKLLK